MKKANVLHVVILVGMLVGCAPGLERFELRRRQQAPAQAADTGVLVRGASTEILAEFLSRHPQSEFRTLNEAHGMYEVFGVNMNDVRTELPTADVSRNEFITTREISTQNRLKLLATETPPADFEKCVQGNNPPQAQIEIQTLKNELAIKVVKEHSLLKFGSKNSRNQQFPNEKLKILWVIMSPDGSGQGELALQQEEIEYRASALGPYGIGLIVQDSRNVCGLDLIEFAVTANRNFAGPNPRPADLARLRLPEIKHLKRLGAEAAWAVSEGAGLTIAIVDSGVNFNHPLLRDRIAINEKEIPNNGVDDDGNGFVDDTVGWDFTFSDNSPFDDVGHGSHVAGLAAGTRIGLAPQARLLPVKALGAFGGDVGSVAAAIRYAVDRGARIVNLSLGSHDTPKKELVDAINYAEGKGVLLVTAAGNGHPFTRIGLNTDVFPLYPASLPNANILNVAAQGNDDNLTLYSNYGVKTVDVAAPGGNDAEPLLSTYLQNPARIMIAPMTGTSMAAPVTAGIAALVWSKNPQLSAVQVKELLMKSGRPDPKLKGAIGSERWLQADAALEVR